MWNPTTNKVYECRYVLSLHWIFYEKPDGPLFIVTRRILEVEGGGGGVVDTNENEDYIDED